MAERVACIDFSKTPKQFRQVALEPGYPLLDKTNANARIVSKWLGRLAAEPERRGEAISWFVRSDQGARLDGVTVHPISSKDTKGSLKGEFQELKQRLEKAEPRTRGEKAVHRSLSEILKNLLEQPSRTDLGSYFLKYQDDQGKWRLLWFWGYERTEPAVGEAAVCVKPDCKTLFVDDPQAAGKCPHCKTPLPIPPNPVKRLAMALLILLLLGGAGFGGWWSLQPRAAISGVVLWEGNNQPIAGASIQIPAWDVSATTDESGQFVIDRLPEGEAEIEISAEGYQPKKLSETLVVGEEIQPTILLKGNSQLTGQVVNGKSDLPLPAADVQIAGTEITAQTDGFGRFQFADLPLGSHQLHVAAAGFPEQDVDVTLQADADNATKVALIGQGVASGVVQKPDKNPIGGATVELVGSGQTTKTDRDGVFVIKEAPTGPARLEFQATGFADKRVDLVIEEKERSINVVLLGAGLLRGVVSRKADDEPIPEAIVTIEDTALIARSDSQGRYTLPGIPAGPVKILISAEGYRTARFDKVVVAGRETLLNAKLEGGAVLAGIVKDGTTNKSLANAEVITTAYPNPLRTDDLGRFKVEGVKAGPAKVTVRASGFQTQMLDVELQPGENENIEVKLLGDTKLRGTVIDAVTNQPVENADVKISGTVLAGKTNPEGEFEISGARSGPAKIEVIAAGYPTAMYSQKLDSGRVTMADPLKIKGETVLTGTVTDLAKKSPVPGAVATIKGTKVSAKANDKGVFKLENLPARNIVLEVSAAGYKSVQAGKDLLAGKPNAMEVQLGGNAALQGKVFDTITNLPVAKASVGVAGNSVVARTDDKGAFLLENVFGGENEIVVKQDGYPQTKLTVDLKANDVTKKDIGITGNAIAKGLILSPEEKPIAGAAVKLKGTTHQTKTDATGAYKLDQLPGGDVTLEASAEHYKSKPISGTLTAGKDVALPDAKLTSDLDISGQVINALTGAGLKDIQVTIEGSDLETTSDNTGGFTLTSVPVRPLTVQFAGNGFFTESLQVDPTKNSRGIKPVLVPVLQPGEVRIVLVWENQVKDLDLHLYGKDLHCSKGQPNAGPARLNLDNANGFGPETMTLTKLPEDTYQIWAHAPRNPINQSGAEVRVYQAGANKPQRFPAKQGPEAAKPAWSVAAIHVDGNGKIEVKPHGRLNYKEKLPGQ